MSRTDPGAARANQVYPPARKCTCGHSEFVHELTAKKVRTACTHTDAAGPCSCAKFESVGWTETLFDQRDAALEAVARVRALHVENKPYAKFCRHCRHPWPCKTIAALDGEVSSDG